MQRYLALLFLTLAATSAIAQPTNNPYRNMYPRTPASHWTEVLKWSSIFNVTNYGANGTDQNSDQSAVEQAIDAASQAGGGVVFFPAGSYILTDNLLLKPGVILRGENPAVVKATDPTFRPSSRLEFPEYIFDTLANGGRGNANSTAFKIIGGIGKFRNVGVINLDINRARIEMHPNFELLGQVAHAGGTTANYQPIENNRNCIVMGVRNNNASMPDPNLPDTTGPAKMRKWQRAPYRFAANFNLYFDENVVIANNRLNDAPTDNFDQPGYRVRNRCTLCDNYKLIGRPNDAVWNAENFIPVISGAHARFRYQDHYGIALNRHKKVIVNGKQTIQPYIWYPEPEQEPSLYAKGFSILDNWVYKTNRVGLWVAGQGMEIRRNVIRDSATVGTSATPKQVWLNPGFGEIQRSFSATYENRGIDFGGSEITIDSNDVQMRTFFFPESGQYGSIDGEGIMDQGNGGGTKPNGIYITNNIVDGDRDDCTNPTIGLYNTLEANNIVYRGNKFTGNSGCLQIQMRDFTMTNVLMENNTGIKQMQFYGNGGGYNCVARNNVGSPGIMDVSCYVILENNTNLTLRTNGCQTTLPNAIDTSAFPAVVLASPLKDTLFTIAPANFQLEAQVIRGTADSVVFYRDAFTRLGKGFSAGNGLWIFQWTPPTSDGKYYITANSYYTPQGGSRVRLKAQPILFEINDGDPLVNNPEDLDVSISNSIESKLKTIVIFPNPASGSFFIQTAENEKIRSVEVIDVMGRVLINENNGNMEQIKCSEISSGLYSIRVKTDQGLFIKRLILK